MLFFYQVFYAFWDGLGLQEVTIFSEMEKS